MSQMRFLSRQICYGSRGLWLGLMVSAMGSVYAQTDAGGFRVPNVDKNGVLVSMLTGENARMFPGKPMEISGLVVEFYEADGKTLKIRIVSPFCNYDTRANTATSDAVIDIYWDGFHIRGEGYTFESASSKMEIHSKVKVIFKNIQFKAPRAQSEPKPDPNP